MPENVRLDRLEQWRITIDDRLWGGGRVEYDQSLEGRLSAMEATARNAEALADAARELRRATHRSVARWVQVTLAVSGVITAVAALVSAVYVIAG